MRFYRNRYTVDITAFTGNIDVLQGRRIIELDYFSKMMQQGCTSCRQPLQLADCVRERKYGSASIYYIKCCKCGQINSVASGKRQNHQKNAQGPFDINTKLGVGLYTFHIRNSIYLCRIACSDFYAKFMKIFMFFVSVLIFQHYYIVG
jgi:hypothetical protein